MFVNINLYLCITTYILNFKSFILLNFLFFKSIAVNEFEINNNISIVKWNTYLNGNAPENMCFNPFLKRPYNKYKISTHWKCYTRAENICALKPTTKVSTEPIKITAGKSLLKSINW